MVKAEKKSELTQGLEDEALELTSQKLLGLQTSSYVR